MADRSAVARSAQHHAQLSISQPTGPAAVGIMTRCMVRCMASRRLQTEPPQSDPGMAQRYLPDLTSSQDRCAESSGGPDQCRQ